MATPHTTNHAKRRPGRPITVNAEAPYRLRAPRQLLAAMRKAARRAGIPTTEAWRRAARAWLAREALPAPDDKGPALTGARW